MTPPSSDGLLNAHAVPGISNETADDAPIIALRDIEQSYPTKKHVLKDFQMTVVNRQGRGQFVCLLGVSGCGKSTVLRYISGLKRPTAGSVAIRGVEQRGQIPVGHVFQQYTCLPWYSVLDNVKLGLDIRGIPDEEATERARSMLARVGLDGHEHKYAQNPPLSGGQLQRVAIARSLMASPDVLLMDEPFSGLDVYTRISMQELLLSIWSELQMTVVFVTHNIQEAVFLGDRILVMQANPGQIVYEHDIPFPSERDISIKRSNRFLEIVHEIEDEMRELETKRQREEARREEGTNGESKPRRVEDEGQKGSPLNLFP